MSTGSYSHAPGRVAPRPILRYSCLVWETVSHGRSPAVSSNPVAQPCTGCRRGSRAGAHSSGACSGCFGGVWFLGDACGHIVLGSEWLARDPEVWKYTRADQVTCLFLVSKFLLWQTDVCDGTRSPSGRWTRQPPARAVGESAHDNSGHSTLNSKHLDLHHSC